VALAVLVNVVMWLALFFTVEPTDRPIILHYNVYFGVSFDSIGNWKNVYMMPAMAAGLLAVNLVISRFFYYKERLASYLFVGMAFLLQVLMAVGAGSVILINF
jgi:hypothetical protein